MIVVTQEWWVTTVFGNLCTCMQLYLETCIIFVTLIFGI
jgi:hypothetical protein